MLNNICILRLSALGDVANCLPALRAIQKRYPQAKITWIIGKTEYQLVKDIPKVNWVVVNKSTLFSSWRQLRSLGSFDVILHMQASFRASILKTALRSPRTIGLDKARSKDFQTWFCNEHISPRAKAHTLETYLDFAKAIDADYQTLEWNLPIGRMHTEAQNIDLPIPYIVVSPCSSKAIRDWTIEGYIAAINHIQEKYGIACVLTGGSSNIERAYADAIIQQTDNTVDLIGQTNVRQMTSILSDALCVIAPDSGPAHTATAVNTPVIGLYANTNPDRARPYLSKAWLVNEYPEAVHTYLHKNVEDIPFGTRVRDPEVMSLIKPEKVCSMVDTLLEGL